jgi:hypothetical protein
MNPKLYDRVALTRDIPDHGLKQGDVATLVDVAPHPNGGPDGLVLEIANALGESLRVAIVTAGDIEPLNANEVLAVRQLAS